ncbi:MAG: DUF2779 domain-containing protein [Melioribacteraceae bacterium]|nr:DUF2779 domain-containing protein [Melioribacteraceae bacterium]
MSGKAVLSKSTFLKGQQCDKHLFLYKHHYNWQDPISEGQQAVFDRGHKVGELAQLLFPGGVNVKPSSPRAYRKAVEDTNKAIDEGAEVIYEAAFIYNEVLVYADILIRNGNRWKVFEVKSSTSISDTNILDISVQYYVIDNAGLEIEDISIIYINNKYIKVGELNLNELFITQSLLPDAIENQLWIDEEVERLKGVISQEELPNIEIGLQCTDPYRCSFIGHCWKDIPPNSVFDISRMHLSKKFELYDQGIIRLNDIPEEYVLPASQQLQVNAHRSGESFIDEVSIKEFLDTIDYPLYFMDFESFQPAVPLYDNSSPYQQIPFQFSLHYQKNLNGELLHEEFLADPPEDPRPQFIEKLLSTTGETGKIIVYNKSFEISRLKEIARDFQQYESEIILLIERIEDIMIPFQKKWYYTPEMQGSYSIKAVLPAIVPELNYNELEIADGESASIAYEKLIYETDAIKIQKIRKNLLTYCQLDTLSMVMIYNKLREI